MKKIQFLLSYLIKELTMSEVVDRTQISRRSLQGFLNKGDCPYIDFVKFLSSVAISESLATGPRPIDYECAKHALLGKEYLHFNYQSNLTSKRINPQSLIHLLKQNFGLKDERVLLNNLQVSSLYLQDISASCSSKLSYDILDYSKEIMPYLDCIKLGQFRLQMIGGANPNHPMKQLSLEALFETLLYEIYNKFETSHEYRIIKLNRHECTIEKKSLTDLISKAACDFSAGFISAIPQLVGNSLPHIEERKCVTRGDDHCEYHLTFAA